MFSVTAEAEKAIEAALEKRGTPDAALRVGIRGGGCSGFMYHLEYSDEGPTERDYVVKCSSFDVYVNKKSMLYLSSSQLDWEDKILTKGFKFINPTTTSKCGCALSFDVDEDAIQEMIDAEDKAEERFNKAMEEELDNWEFSIDD